MAPLPDESCRRSVRPAALGIIFTLSVVFAGGCANRVYRATDLPAELMAPVTANIEAIDLSRLANRSVNSQMIDRGDVIEVTIVTDYAKLPTTTTPVRVGEDGMAGIPLIGKMALAGFELEGAEQAIAAAGIARGVFQNPHVTVTMKRQRMNRVTVIGAVNEPGMYELARGSCSLLAALVSAGGLSDEAGPDVEIRRATSRAPLPGVMPPHPQRTAEGERVQPVSYQSPSPPPGAGPQITRVSLTVAAADGHGGRYLEDGDVVMVTKRAPKPVYVMGLVRQPGEFELPPNQDMYLLDVLPKAGGRSMQAADKVFVIRKIPGREEPVVIQTSVRQAKVNGLANVRLAPGDIVSVEETPTTLVLDALKSFIRFGMTSSIPLF